MKATRRRQEFLTVTRAAQHVWLAVAFILLWLQFSYVREHVRGPNWQIYSLYFLAVAGISCRYLTGVRHGQERWHRIVFDGLTILFISLGVNLTGGIRSDLWLVYFIFVIAETLAASAREVLVTDVFAVLSYVVATWPARTFALPEYLERLVTHVFFLVLVASIARTIAWEERARQEDLAALREALGISEERRRLARDLHDGIGHILTRVILSLEVARRQNAGDPRAAAECIAQQTGALRGAMEEMRQIVSTLRTDTAAFGLDAALRTMAAQMAGSGALEVEVTMPATPLPLSAHRQYHLSRVIQEAITNCLRHSQAPRVAVAIELVALPVGGAKVVAAIVDEGVGFDPAFLNGRTGHGLQGMAERLLPYGGRVSVESAPGEGTRVTAEVPCDAPA